MCAQCAAVQQPGAQPAPGPATLSQHSSIPCHRGGCCCRRAMDLRAQLAQLDEKGFCVVRQLVPRELTSQARGLVDAIIGSSPPPPPQLGLEQVCTEGAARRGQPGPWPEPGEELPVIASGNYTHSIHHPIAASRYGYPGLMAKLLERYVHVNQALLRVPDSDLANLKCMQQFFRRTDLGPAYGDDGQPSRHGVTGQGCPPTGWHMDQAFLPRHYETVPRQMFYHTILACTPVVQDGAPFFCANGSYKRAKAMSQRMTMNEQHAVVPYADMTRTKLGSYLHELARRDGGEIFDRNDYEEVRVIAAMHHSPLPRAFLLR
jgi:hypothetical protein